MKGQYLRVRGIMDDHDPVCKCVVIKYNETG